MIIFSGVARPFPGGRVVHPRVKLRKKMRKNGKKIKEWGENGSLLSTRGWESFYTPDQFDTIFTISSIEDNYADFRLACRSPPCRYVAWSPVAVSWFTALSGHAAVAYHQAASFPSWIEVNCMQSAAVGKAARLLIYWQDAACRLVIPLRQVALAQLNKYHHQSGNAASGKLVWKQLYGYGLFSLRLIIFGLPCLV